MRLFVAVDLPVEIKKKASDFISDIKNLFNNVPVNIKWTPRDNMHITVKFLGDIKKNKVDKIKEAVMTAAETAQPSEYEFNRTGVFTKQKPRVLWLGTKDENKNIVRLAENLDNRLVSLGFTRGKNNFISHLTVGRIKKGRLKTKLLERYLSVRPDFKFKIDKLSLFKSKLTSVGARHTIIYNANFKN